MNFKILLFVLVAAFVMGCTDDFDNPRGENESSTEHKIISRSQGAEQGMLAIKLTHNDPSDQELRSALDKIEATGIRRLFHDHKYEQELTAAGLDLWYKVSFNPQSDLRTTAKELSKAGSVSLVEFMHKPLKPRVNRSPLSSSPAPTRSELPPTNDPLYCKQWNLKCEDYTSPEGWVWSHLADINIEPAWEICSGDESIVVAVLDEAVQSDHPDLEANIWHNPDPEESQWLHGANFCTPKDEPIELYWSYRNGFTDHPSHGTHVAGSIAAVNGNMVGIAGIAGGKDGSGGVKIMSCQVFSNRDEVEEAIANAYIWAANRGALIAQCSFGYDYTLSESDWKRNYGYEVDAIDYFINHPRPNSPINGGLVIFAAGNDGNSTLRGEKIGDYRYAPGCYEPTIAVAATTPSCLPACFSCYGNWIDISAPGGDSDYTNEALDIDGKILSTTLTTDRSYGNMEGTSMACPQISGVAALGLSYAAKLGKSFTTEEFRDMLLSSTNHIDNFFVGSRTTRGFNYSKFTFEDVVINHEDYKGKMGGGLVDAFKMLMFVENTPIITVGLDESHSIDAGLLFGGESLSEGFSAGIADIKAAEEKLGLKLIIEGDRLLITCSKTGTSKIRLWCDIGQTTVEREVAVIVRESSPLNGGWL